MKDFDAATWKFLVDENPHHWRRFSFSINAMTDLVDNKIIEVFLSYNIEARYVQTRSKSLSHGMGCCNKGMSRRIYTPQDTQNGSKILKAATLRKSNIYK